MDVASPDTPKFVGEPLGRVSDIKNGSFRLHNSERLHPGDGITFFDKDGTLSGSLVNGVKEGRVRADNLKGMDNGTEVYRNLDKEFLRAVERDGARRKFALRLEFSDYEGGLELKASDERGASASVKLRGVKTPAEKPEAALETIKKQLSKLGETEFYLEALELKLTKPYFVPVSAINDLRREVLAALEKAAAGSPAREELKIIPSEHPYPETVLDHGGNVLNSKAARFYKRHGVTEIGLAAEAGGFGADYISEKRPDIFGKEDMFFVPDSGTEDGSLIEVAEKSIMWMKVITHGKQCHASRPKLGINAFKAASELITKYQKLYKKFPKKDRLYEPPISTFEPTKKENNVPNVNTLPGEDVFYMDCRVMPCYPLAEVKAEMRKMADEVEAKFGVKISFEPQQEAQAAPPTDPKAAIVLALKKGIKEVLGVKAKAYGIGGGTVAAFFRRLNLPVVVYARLNETAHMPNEYCVIDHMMGDAKVFAITTLLLCRK